MAIIATIGASDANSFVTAAEANAYFTDHWSLAKAAVWEALAQKPRERLLLAATNIIETVRFLDTDVNFGFTPEPLRSDYGEVLVRRLYPNQKLSFPRSIDADPNGVGYIPQAVKDAQCEQAIYLVTFDESGLAAQYQGITEESVVAGPARAYTNYGRIGTMLAPMAAELLRPYFRTHRKWGRG